MTARTPIASTVHEPHGKPGGPGAFGMKGAQFPAYIQHVAGEMIKKGKTKSQAYRLAIGIVRNWAHGHNRGHTVSPQVQAAAAKAIAQYNALRARARSKPNKHEHTTARESVELAKPSLTDRSGMIALEVPKGTLPHVPGGLSDHHVTLAFLGDDVDDRSYAKAIRAARHAAARHGPLAGKLGGIGAFPPGDDGTPVWATVDVPGLAELRQAVVGHMGGQASEHGYTPHATLSYVKPGQPMPKPLPPTNVKFGHVSVHRGDQVVRIPLSGGHEHTEARMTVDLAWNPSAHPRAKAGSGTGGQFVPLSSGSGYATKKHGRKGKQVKAVKAVQTLLNRRGVRDKNGNKLAVDGYYGPLTTSAIAKFQKSHGLHTTGKVDRETLTALRTGTHGQGKKHTDGKKHTAPGHIGKQHGGQKKTRDGVQEHTRPAGWYDEGGINPPVELAKANTGTSNAADLNTAARRKLAARGQAMQGGRYPIRNRSDLAKAIHAVGRGKGSHAKIRAYIMRRAKALGAMDMIPDSWRGHTHTPARESVDLAKPKLGTGTRFAALVAKLTKRGYSPESARKIAASIGRRKYGAKKMGRLSHHTHAADHVHVIEAARIAGDVPTAVFNCRDCDTTWVGTRQDTVELAATRSGVLLAPNMRSEAIELGRHTFRKQILPIGDITYRPSDGPERTLSFTRDYLADLAKAFRESAFDAVPFVLADAGNRHTMEPERARGEIAGLELTESGLDAIVNLSDDAAALVRDHPKLGVSARIVEHLERADGKTWPAAIQHVLGTWDPRITGMAPWEAVELSTSGESVVDLSSEVIDLGKEEDVGSPLTDEETTQLAGLLSKIGFTMEPADTKPADTKLADTDDDGFEEVTGDELDELLDSLGLDGPDDEGDPELVGAGAELSADARQAIELANARASEADDRVRAMEVQLAEQRWAEERGKLEAQGVTPVVLDLARPLLSQPGESAIDLSNGQTADPAAVVRKILAEVAAGNAHVDLSRELGTGADNTGDDPEAKHRKALLDAWPE